MGTFRLIGGGSGTGSAVDTVARAGVNDNSSRLDGVEAANIIQNNLISDNASQISSLQSSVNSLTKISHDFRAGISNNGITMWYKIGEITMFDTYHTFTLAFTLLGRYGLIGAITPCTFYVSVGSSNNISTRALRGDNLHSEENLAIYHDTSVTVGKKYELWKRVRAWDSGTLLIQNIITESRSWQQPNIYSFEINDRVVSTDNANVIVPHVERPNLTLLTSLKPVA